MSEGVVDVRALPPRPGGTRAPEFWGILALVAIEAMVFTALIASYFHFRFQNAAWPPAGIEAPHIPLATANTLLLVATVLPVWLSVRSLRGGGGRLARVALPVAMVMLATFLGVKLYEYLDLPWGPRTHAYGSVVFLMSGLHMAHVIALLVKTGVVYAYLLTGRVDPDRPAPLEANAVYWYFVVLVWIPLYTAIYLAPRAF